jgi:hypothetical protein
VTVTAKTRFEYLSVLDHIHQVLRPRTYVEIGVRFGTSMQLALPGTSCVGIDPAAEMRYPVPRQTRVFNSTSDDFFAAQDLRAVFDGRAVDIAFVDGMHWFEFALRDFMNLERAASTDSMILVHDCYPIDAESAARERSTKLWSGDVWKMILALREHRPDLRVATLDAAPTGLAVITGLDPASTVLTERYQAIVDQYADVAFATIEHDKAARLNRSPADLATVDTLLPRPFRATNETLLRAGRALRPPTPAQLRSRVARRRSVAAS